MARKTIVVYVLSAIYAVVWCIVVFGYYSRLTSPVEELIIAAGVFVGFCAVTYSRHNDWKVAGVCALILGLSAIEVCGLNNLIPAGDIPGALYMCSNVLIPAVLGVSSMYVVRLIAEQPRSNSNKVGA